MGMTASENLINPKKGTPTKLVNRIIEGDVGQANFNEHLPSQPCFRQIERDTITKPIHIQLFRR